MRGVRRLLALLLLALLAPIPGTGLAGGCDPDTSRSAEAALREVLDLWKAERYEAVHARGYLEHQAAIPPAVFARLLRREDRVPQCCWLTLRDVTASCDGAAVYLRGRVGYEIAGHVFDPARGAFARDTAPRVVEEVWPLVWPSAAWRVDLYQVLGPSLYYWEQAPGIIRRFDSPPPGRRRR